MIEKFYRFVGLLMLNLKGFKRIQRIQKDQKDSDGIGCILRQGDMGSCMGSSSCLKILNVVQIQPIGNDTIQNPIRRVNTKSQFGNKVATLFELYVNNVF